MSDWREKLRVRIGAAVDSIDWSSATYLSPLALDTRRIQGSDQTWTRRADGSRVEVPREQLLSELRELGGRAQLGELGVQVRDARVARLWLRGEEVKLAPWRSERDLQALGKPIGVERRNGERTHHFPAEQLSVVCNARTLAVVSVVLGPVEWTPPVFRARDVLEEWLALPRPERQAESAWRESVAVRRNRALALLRAFQLGTLESFAEGTFLREKRIEDLPRVARAFREAEFELDQPGLPHFFSRLLRYRKQAEELLEFNAHILEAAPGGFALSIFETGVANREIARALERIDTLLCELISPGDRAFTFDEMVERFAWPDVDLDQMLDDEI
jgi:hypothetical protein